LTYAGCSKPVAKGMTEHFRNDGTLRISLIRFECERNQISFRCRPNEGQDSAHLS
jgi:hypothetical protein